MCIFLLVLLWLSVEQTVMLKCAVLCCAVVALALLHLYWSHRWILIELQRVKKECNNCNCCCSRVSLTPSCGNVREKRDLSSHTSQRTPRQKKHTEQRNFLHLVPVSMRSNDEKDMTVLTWALGLNQGTGLKVDGESITVASEGLYFIYSQVLYKDSTWFMGHVISKRLNGDETKLMKCVKSMPSNVSMPLNTCYTAGVHFLESGSVLELSVPRRSAGLVLSAQATFMGFISI